VAANPDDEEFVNSAAMFNCKLALRYRQKGKEMVQISTIWKTDNKYEILANRKFSSDIKYMCTILRGCETGKIKLLLKGADSVVLDLLSDQEKNNWKEKKLGEILANEAADGFRILYWGQKDLTEEEFNSWWAKYGKLIESSVEGDNSPQLKEAWLEVIFRQ
jgi:phospholipid-translocating ATPase